MVGWKKVTEPFTYTEAIGGAADTLVIGMQNLQGRSKSEMSTLPSEALKTYFAPAGESTEIWRDGVYKGSWKYEGVRPYLDLSTPLNAIQNLGSITAGKGPSGNYTVSDLNPLYLQTDKEMLAKQAEIKANPNVQFSEVVPLKMEVGSISKGLWDMPHEDPVGAAMYYGMPIGFAGGANAVAWTTLRSGTAARVAANPIVRNVVQFGMDAMMVQMVADTALKVPGYITDPLGVVFGKPLIGRTVTGFDNGGNPIYASQSPQSVGERFGSSAGEVGLMYLGGLAANQINFKSIHQTPITRINVYGTCMEERPISLMLRLYHSNCMSLVLTQKYLRGCQPDQLILVCES